MIDNFKQCVENAEKILITSHTSPDPDAAASLLLLGTALQINFPNKKIEVALEDEPQGLNFLTGYEHIKFQPLAPTVLEFTPNLFIMVDAMSVSRCTRKGEEAIKKYLKQSGAKTVIIDHHQKTNIETANVALVTESVAAVQDIYELLFDQLNLKKPRGYAQTTMTGLYSDSGGFAYADPHHEKTLKLASDLISAGANIEQIKNQLYQYSEDQMRVIGELAVNITHEDDYTYTFISDEFAEKWQELDKPIDALHMACKQFINEYIRNVGGRQWGFLVYSDPLEGENFYSVSLRSVANAKNVAEIAAKLEGGGHKPAAGGKVHAKNVQEALEKVRAAIAQSA